MNISKEEKDVLFHTLGYNYKDTPFRNYFLTSATSSDYKHLASLEDKGLVGRAQTPSFLDKKDILFYVTDTGKSLAKELYIESQPKLTRSQKRYQLYLQSEADEPFGVWLKMPYWDDYRKRYGV